jgi:hypothetical protein
MKKLWPDRSFEMTLILGATLLSLSVFQSFSSAASGVTGAPAPYFSVKSGDDRELTLDMIRGKVGVIFYENKDIVDANKKLKDELNALYHEQGDALKDTIVRLPVIDCSGAVRAFRWIWKKQLIAHSRKEGMTIYCDWDGKMFSDYKMEDGVSNVVIIDKRQRIRFFTAGEVTTNEINHVKQLLKRLTRE